MVTKGVRRIPPVGKLFDRLPPHSLEAEMSLLGSIILDPKVLPDVLAAVAGDDFYSDAHAAVFEAATMVYRELGALDLVTLLEMLRDRQELADVGGREYLLKLAETVPSAVNAPHYARIVADKGRLRRVLDAASQTLHRVYHLHETEGVDELCSTAVAELAQAATPRNSADDIALAKADDLVFESLDKKEPALVPTGITGWDRAFGGWPTAGVVVVLGWPSSGKTTLVLDVAEHMADHAGAVVRVFSYEQPAKRVAATILSARAGVTVHRMLNRGELPDQAQWQKLRDARARHARLDFKIVEQNMDADGIYARMAAVRSRRPDRPLVAVVDYLQHLPWPQGVKDPVVAITQSMNRLADVARRLGAIVVVVCQPTQAAVKEDRCPRMGDANGAQAISARADMAFAVYRPNQQRRLEIPEGLDGWARQRAIEDWREEQAVTQLHMLKNKYERLGMIDLRFDGERMRFEEVVESGGSPGRGGIVDGGIGGNGGTEENH